MLVHAKLQFKVQSLFPGMQLNRHLPYIHMHNLEVRFRGVEGN